MADYTKLTTEEIKILTTSYNIGKLVSISPMPGGQANSSFKLSTSEDDFILSVCDEKNFIEIDYLTQMLVYLELYDFPTSRLIKTRDKSCFIKYGNKPVFVKKYIEGEVSRTLNSSKLVRLGEVMAALHAVPPLGIMPKRFPYGMEYFNTIFETHMQNPYIDWLKQKNSFLKQSIDHEMDKGFVHGDLFWDNLLFLKDKLVAVLDFEEVCHYYKLFDLGMCAVGCCEKDGSFDMEKTASLLNGYQRHFVLRQDERKQLKIFIEYAAVAASSWRFHQYNIKYPDHHLAQSYLTLSSLADHIHGMGDNEFMAVFANPDG